MSYEREEENNQGGGDEEYDGHEVAPQVAELANASVPNNVRTIRACKRCGLLKTQEQFYDDGCENCVFLDMADNMERVNSCTTAFYDGHVAVMDPMNSWAARWIRVDNFLPGVYAVTITGQFDQEIEEDLENQGIRWRCRPTTVAN
jgi:transcription elongation factor SPT4